MYNAQIKLFCSSFIFKTNYEIVRHSDVLMEIVSIDLWGAFGLSLELNINR
jgi:hypothetical protein